MKHYLAFCALLPCFADTRPYDGPPNPSKFLTQTEIQELKAYIAKHLSSKVGPTPKLVQPPKTRLEQWALRLLEPAAKAKNTEGRQWAILPPLRGWRDRLIVFPRLAPWATTLAPLRGSERSRFAPPMRDLPFYSLEM
ncbi:MAG: hypothetical protein JNM56_28585 [Planctomycetia bacterium]|nr:hypothetical protein [Planctomycetia bacterium]